MTGTPRPAIDAIVSYKPGKSAAAAEEEHGIADAIKLASNETPWPPIMSAQEAMIKAASATNRYADPTSTVVKAKLAGWLGVDLDMVCVGNGSVGLLQQITLSYLDSGDEVVFPWRSFEIYPLLAQLVEARTITPPLVAEAFDIGAVAKAVTDQTKLVILSNPNNPSGTAHTTSDLRTFLDQVGEQTLVVVDEAYHEFADPALGDPVVDLLPDYPNLMVIRTFSKAQGLAFLRFGYGVASPEVVATIDKTLLPFAVNGMAQVAAVATIDNHDEVDARVAEIVSERARVSKSLIEAGYDVPVSQANFVYLPLGDSTDDVYLALEQQGVVTRAFSGEGIRVTISTPEENDRFLVALANT